MTNPVETIEVESALQPEQSPVSVAEVVVNVGTSRQAHEPEFLDEEWSREFDRRLAAWESESACHAPHADTIARD